MPPKRQNELNLKQKIEVLQQIESKTYKYSQIAVFFNIGKGTITNINNNKESLQLAY